MKKFQITSTALTALIAVATFWPSAEYSLADEAVKMAQAGRDHRQHGMPSPKPITPDDMTRRERFPFVPQTATYPTLYVGPPNWYTDHGTAGANSPVYGDGSNRRGGTPPAITQGKEPPDIPSNFNQTGWTQVGSSYNHIPATEPKFRMHCNYSHHAWEDPILYPNRRGPYGNSHLHTFFGNTKMGADSTYQSLRTTGESTCTGGKLNRSGYWYPSVLKDDAIGDGKTMIVKPNFAVVYYVETLQTFDQAVRFPRGFQYITGFDLSNPSTGKDATHEAEIAAANTASVAAGGYSDWQERTIAQNGVNGFLGWKCEATNGGTQPGAFPVSGYTGIQQPYLRNADGTPTMVCPIGEMIGFVTVTPQCWDGVNLWAPNGRSHTRHTIRNGSGRQDMCPTGWYRLPDFQLIIWFTHNGSSDYKEWYFSSDRVPGGTTFLNGQTGHSDWYGAWDYTIMSSWMKNCNGITFEDGTGGNEQECDSSTIGDGEIANQWLCCTRRNPQPAS
jgi:hypothetical protein